MRGGKTEEKRKHHRGEIREREGNGDRIRGEAFSPTAVPVTGRTVGERRKLDRVEKDRVKRREQERMRNKMRSKPEGVEK